MCGIVGYVGPDEALPIVVEGLRRLEYRGYDSAGVAVVDDGRLGVVKRAGKLVELEAALADGRPPHRHRGHGAHAVGHPRRTQRPQRAPAPGLHRSRRRDPQRDHRELPGAAGAPREGRPHVRLRHRHRMRGAPHRGEAARGRGRGLARPTPCAPPCADWRAPTRWWCARWTTPARSWASRCRRRWWWGWARARPCSPPTSRRCSIARAVVVPLDEGQVVEITAAGATFTDLDGTPLHAGADHGGLGRRPGAEVGVRRLHAARRSTSSRRRSATRWWAG